MTSADPWFYVPVHVRWKTIFINSCPVWLMFIVFTTAVPEPFKTRTLFAEYYLHPSFYIYHKCLGLTSFHNTCMILSWILLAFYSTFLETICLAGLRVRSLWWRSQSFPLARYLLGEESVEKKRTEITNYPIILSVLLSMWSGPDGRNMLCRRINLRFKVLFCQKGLRK